MVTNHVNTGGEIIWRHYDSPMEAPWFRKVVEEAEAYLDSVYQLDPNLCTAWYREHRAKKDAENC